MCRVIFRQTKILGKIISAIEAVLAAGVYVGDLSVKIRVNDLVALYYPMENQKRLFCLISADTKTHESLASQGFEIDFVSRRFLQPDF